jgi:Uma2 family endonuclease
VALYDELTIEDYEQLPDALALNHELVDGKLVDVSGNTAFHNTKGDSIVSRMLPHIGSRELGLVISEQEFDFGGNAHGPDVSFIASSKLHLLNPNRRVQLFVPDLAIEIVSNTDKSKDILKKAKRYRRYGTLEVWVMDLENRQALVFAEDRQVILGDDALFESKLIPGFSIRLAELFDWA